jgi:hypothetical protein
MVSPVSLDACRAQEVAASGTLTDIIDIYRLKRRPRWASGQRQ